MDVMMPIKIREASVADFYAGKSVFVTGGTGFIGKVLIEKLLYGCPDIDKIFMLIRAKKGLSIRERLNRFCDDPFFDRLKEKRPASLEKIVPIHGDIGVPNLGIDAENEKILLEEISVIIHSAATVKFNEPLPDAWKINVEGTKIMLDLCRRMKRVEVFIHISTAYTNTNRDEIDEVLYPPPADIKEVYQKIKQGVSEEDTVKMLNGRPNTYTFTKSLTEHLVAENNAFVPTVIIRPSVVGAIKEDPIKGWLENWYGGTGIAVFTAKGLNRVFYGSKNNILDVVPVDYVANLIIVAGAKSSKSNDVQIYNCSSSSCNPITLGKYVGSFAVDAVEQNNYAVPLPGWYTYSRHKWLVVLITVLFQVIPAYLADICRRLVGKNPRYVKLQSLVIQTRAGVDSFTSNSWVIKAEQVRKLYASLSLADKHMFPCDPSLINWGEYMRDYCWGVRQFLERRTN